MRRGFRIIETEEIEKKYFPVLAFFNAIPDIVFIRTIQYMIMGVGASFNNVHCEFPGDLDPDDNMFEGVRFAVFNEEIVLDYQMLFYFLKKASEVYVEDNPKDEEAIQHLLREYCNKYELSCEV